ncbi:cadherin-like beta sandwich domain-containing protein [[Clostridium] scindens]|uniref:cadherin-like beta sandwich domain-containing protein n=1 Tax=Clostridium scindens (strain JCM 10418 / VPI 12708) TaxID=29347 RepID=UPI003FCDE231
MASLGLGALTLTPTFDPGVTEYSTSTTNQSNTISATGANGSTVTITVNGEPHKNGASATWEDGENTVKITAKNNTGEKIYTVTVTKTGA